MVQRPANAIAGSPWVVTTWTLARSGVFAMVVAMKHCT